MKMSSISLKAVGLSMRASPLPLPPSIISLQMGNVAYREFSAANDFEQRTQEETYFPELSINLVLLSIKLKA